MNYSFFACHVFLLVFVLPHKSQLVPKYYLYCNVSGLYYMSSYWLNELCMRLNLQFIVIWYIGYSFFLLFSTSDYR